MDPPTAGVMSASPYPTRTLSPPNADGENRKNVIVRRVAFILKARAEITSHFAAGPQARWRGASDGLYPGRYVRSEQQSQRACGPQPAGARRRRARIGFVAAPRRCPTSPSSRRLASARPALAPKWEFNSFLREPLA